MCLPHLHKKFSRPFRFLYTRYSSRSLSALRTLRVGANRHVFVSHKKIYFWSYFNDPTELNIIHSMAESLAQAGLYIDDFYKLRIVDPRVAQETNELKEECEKYLSKMNDFKVIIGELFNLISSVAEKVESQKLKAIGSRNLLTSMEKQRDLQQKHLESQILAKKKDIDRLNIQLQSLQKEEAEQTEFIERFLMGR
ncbi:Intraflagellar transport protein 20, variant 2 [Schistosoma haematobium]|uniref:Intraflagellar transport protein 20, variant 2 n=2 Tax=Schistosoma haematobium TaxID=6185 RepID=A0A6A5D8N4_SCHHA|nr:Intraflagellar transport protein 20, variant 2 [Schistosoma haematobium]KAH9593946.1 Intraflagellar transport protein 20, variant 2 [Schistosoma haematobium]